MAGTNRGTIRNSSADVNIPIVRGATTGGGLVGTNISGTIVNSFANGDVQSILDVTIGGLVGISDGGVIRNTYASGLVNIVSAPDPAPPIGTKGWLIGSVSSGQVLYNYAGNTSAPTDLGQSPSVGRVPNTLYIHTGGTLTTFYSYFYSDNVDGTDNMPGSPDNKRSISQLQQTDSATSLTYTGWTTANWDFGGPSQLPAIKRNNVASYENTDERGDPLPDLLPGQGR